MGTNLKKNLCLYNFHIFNNSTSKIYLTSVRQLWPFYSSWKHKHPYSFPMFLDVCLYNCSVPQQAKPCLTNVRPLRPFYFSGKHRQTYGFYVFGSIKRVKICGEENTRMSKNFFKVSNNGNKLIFIKWFMCIFSSRTGIFSPFWVISFYWPN